MANKNSNLNNAKKAKNDEFYTQLSDIEAELKHYKAAFQGKTVLCNCDDPRVSNFTLYFLYNFQHLGLKRLISTCYKNNEPDLFSDGTGEKACYLDFRGEKPIRCQEDIQSLDFRPLEGDGDFRSPECIEFLKEADIVASNPPFSLFRQYISLLMEYEKQFVIIGNKNAIAYKEVFPLIMADKIWLGQSIHSGDLKFAIPDHIETYSKNLIIDKTGKRYVGIPGVRWFTNIDVPIRHEGLILTGSYTKYPERYPRYDNYDAINVDNVKDIPEDYFDIIGVPITYIDKYCPEQFEILGIAESSGSGLSYGLLDTSYGDSHPIINGERKYTRLFIRRKRKAA